jgi:hypothetical protein
MEHRGIEYTVVQSIQRGVWKWSAFVAGARIFGQESIRSAAVAAAESAIDRALADPSKNDIRETSRRGTGASGRSRARKN